MWAFICVPGQTCRQGLPDGITETDFVKLKGDQGVQGIQGLAGVTGAQGIEGVTGATGAQGVQGIQGIQGETGPQGATGSQGDGVWKGLWEEATQYEEGDHVKWDGLPYALICSPGSMCIQGQPGMDNDWLLLRTIGATGGEGTQGIQGTQGQLGAQGIQGRSSFQGTWSDSITYHEGDIVTYNEIPYHLICPEGIACRNDAPTSETSLWEPLRMKGDQGEAGATGAAGVDADIMIILLGIAGATLVLIIIYLFIALKWYYVCCPPGGNAYRNVGRTTQAYAKEPVDIAYDVMLDKEVTIIF